MIKRISVLGSTGSVGTQTLEVVRKYRDAFKISALCAHSNVALLARQAEEFRPELVAITDENAYLNNKHLFKEFKVCAGAEALEVAASIPSAEVVVAAVSGMQGFKGVVAAARQGKTIALANKESLVAGGKIVTAIAKKNKVKLLPVDSEHSAVWQCLEGNNKKNLAKIILTASGGPFYHKTKQDLQNVTPEEACSHPTWAMGKKISIDSATMMNKGLEIIEAKWLFNTCNIDYVIHPESIVHSLVEFTDGAMLAQMSRPSMLYPIQLALTYPKRLPIDIPTFDFSKPLQFLPPKEDVFLMPKLCKEAMHAHEGAPLVLNAANEAAVSLFLNKRITFGHIFNIACNIMETADFPDLSSEDSVQEAHAWWYAKVLADYRQYI